MPPADPALPPAAPALPPAELALRADVHPGLRRLRAGGRPSPLLVVSSTTVAVLFAGPLAYLVYRNITLGADLWATVRSPLVYEPLQRTLVLAVAVSASAAALGTALAWLTTRSDVPLRKLWRLLAPLPLVFPSFVGAAALVAAFAPGGLLDELLSPVGVQQLPPVRGFAGAWLVLTLFTYPYVYLPVAARFASLAPSLEESARLLGRRPVEVFRTVVLAQSWGAVAAGTLLVFLYTVSDFGAVAILRYDTITRVIEANYLTNPTRALSLGLVLVLVTVAVVIGERAVGRRRLVSEAVRAKRPLHVPLGRWRLPALAAVVVLMGGALLAPVVVLGYWAVRGLLRGDTAATSLATDVGGLLEPAVNTALVSVATAAVAVAVVLPVAYLTSRHRSRLGGSVNAVVVGGFALPGLVIALSLVFWVRQAPLALYEQLYQALPLLVFAYVVHFGAQAMRASQVAVGAVPGRLDDAARMLGAGRARRFASIEWPLMRPGLLAGAGLVLLSTMKELPATLLLAPIGFDTLATRIWGASQDGFLAETGLTSLVLVAVSAVLTWFLVARRTERFA
ncbi:iron ABC transporter permease [soil metagenome]